VREDIKDIECEEAIRMVLEYLDNELEHNDHEALENHIHKCRSCFSRVEFEKRLKGKVRDVPQHKAPESLVDRIKQLSNKF
jgi:anti-sigma factor (TIGR02949 family)